MSLTKLYYPSGLRPKVEEMRGPFDVRVPKRRLAKRKRELRGYAAARALCETPEWRGSEIHCVVSSGTCTIRHPSGAEAVLHGT